MMVLQGEMREGVKGSIEIEYRHLSNDTDPIVKALDPFQLLPASKDIHKKGLIK